MSAAQETVLRVVEYSRRQVANLTVQVRHTAPGLMREALWRQIVYHTHAIALGEVWLSNPRYMRLPQDIPRGLGSADDVCREAELHMLADLQRAEDLGEPAPPTVSWMINPPHTTINPYINDGWLSRRVTTMARA